MPRAANPAAVARLLAGVAREQARCGRRGRPFVTLTWAQSLDGCIAREPGQRTVISGDETMSLAHALRASHDGILIGVGTLVADDPALTVRLWSGESPTPIVLDTRLRTPLSSRLVLAGQQRSVFIACTNAADEQQRIRLETL
ncbi:MAG TPA: dihydrofolate reductase family protein, partial [Polyangia bacterium]